MLPFSRFLPSLLALSLAACTTADPDDLGLRSSAALLPQTSSSTVPVGVMLPPAAGPALASTERNGPQSRLRRTVLRGDASLPGENFVSVETGGPQGVRSGLLRPPPAETLGAEMRAAMPGVPMRAAAAMEQNGSGPFGYAAGSAGTTACIYAWQWLDFSGRSGFLRKRDPASIRVRLCRQEGTEALLRIVRAMRFAASEDDSALNPELAGWAGGDALAATGVPVAASTAADTVEEAEADAAPIAPRPQLRRVRPAQAVTAAPPATEPTEAAAGPAIPVPEAMPAASAHPAASSARPRTLLPPARTVAKPAEDDDDAPLIPDPGTTAATR